MKPEKNNQTLTRWLLIATIALLALVLGLQLWQMFGRKPSGYSGSLTTDPANGPAAPAASQPSDPPAAGVSSRKDALIEDVRALNAGLSAADLAGLSTEELEQLWKTGAPGLPIGMSAAAQAAEEYAGILAADAVTSETDPELDEAPAHYDVELRHPVMGEFSYKIDAYTGAVLEGTPGILQDAAASQDAPGTPAASPAPQTPDPAATAPATQEPASAPQETAPAAQTPAAQESASAPQASSQEAAKNAAFAHAGVSAADASAVRCEPDWEDGRQIYEIEFRVGGTEYEYEIDAATGAVIKAEMDR